MKKTLLLFFFLFPFFLPAQKDSLPQYTTKNCSLDLDFGMEVMKIENAHLPQNFFDTLHSQVFTGYIGGLNFYRRITYIQPLWSVGFFIKPFFGTNMHKNSFAKSWLSLQLPIGIATEFGKTDEHSPGIMFGAAIDLNVNDFSEYHHVPAFWKPKPYFFLQVHEGVGGIRFSACPAQSIANKDGTITRTSFDFEIAIIATGRF